MLPPRGFNPASIDVPSRVHCWLLQAENAALKKLLEEVTSGSTLAQERVADLRARYAHLLTVRGQGSCALRLRGCDRTELELDRKIQGSADSGGSSCQAATMAWPGSTHPRIGLHACPCDAVVMEN